jgi:hypothetical protein
MADDEILIFEISGIMYFVYDIGMRMLETQGALPGARFPGFVHN